MPTSSSAMLVVTRCVHTKRFFYWPSLIADVSHHIRNTQANAETFAPLPMQEREVVRVPSESVCVDIVGSFPSAKGGFRFLLIYIDMATR